MFPLEFRWGHESDYITFALVLMTFSIPFLWIAQPVFVCECKRDQGEPNGQYDIDHIDGRLLWVG